MPIDRLTRTRASLPEGYQFGDAGKQPTGCLWCGRSRGEHVSHRAHKYVKPYPLHRADTADPDGYGHAV